MKELKEKQKIKPNKYNFLFGLIIWIGILGQIILLL